MMSVDTETRRSRNWDTIYYVHCGAKCWLTTGDGRETFLKSVFQFTVRSSKFPEIFRKSAANLPFFFDNSDSDSIGVM